MPDFVSLILTKKKDKTKQINKRQKQTTKDLSFYAFQSCDYCSRKGALPQLVCTDRSIDCAPEGQGENRCQSSGGQSVGGSQGGITMNPLG